MSRAGLASRRAAEDLIKQGRVSVNGHVVTELGFRADPVRDRIIVDGHPLIIRGGAPTVVLLHKPKGIVTTCDDPEQRTTVLDLLPLKYRHLHPIGRLDYDTSGVLLLTDDGELSHLLSNPSHGVE
jgi:23S rRNA pseudouridine2605 synthase